MSCSPEFVLVQKQETVDWENDGLAAATVLLILLGFFPFCFVFYVVSKMKKKKKEILGAELHSLSVT